jgi:choline dehydrogenase-like flavoprotein
MGLDPERSVVNEWGRCHDVKNLFIVDGSIWVTSGGVNPTPTIQALALYIATTSSSAWPPYSIELRMLSAEINAARCFPPAAS